MPPALHAPSNVPTRSLALINQKGGVGKTTTTVNLAAALALAGKSTLLIDLDPQAHATLHLGVEPSSTTASVYDVLLDPSRSTVTSAVVNVRPNLDLLPAEVDLAAAESELANEPDRHNRLSTALSHLQNKYDFLLIDCPPSLGLLTLNALATAREVVVPMQAHFLALQGLSKLLETVSLVARSANPRLRISGVVLCMHEDVTKLSREVVADLESFFAEARKEGAPDLPWRNARVYRPPVRRNIKLAECPSFGQTIFEYAPSAPGAQDYKDLAASVIAEWDAVLSRMNTRRAPSTSEPAEIVTTTDPARVH
ncbi:MAG: ParA family protein [Phycisphaerales bacterium]